MWTWQGGGGVCQMSILLHKPYLVKWSIKGRGVINIQNSVHMVYGRPLTKVIIVTESALRFNDNMLKI